MEYFKNRLSKLIIVDKWQEIGCEGDRPPPCSRFSFNKIDRQRALLFGGKQDKYKTTYKDVYILDLETKVGTIQFIMVWVLVIIIIQCFPWDEY